MSTGGTGQEVVAVLRAYICDARAELAARWESWELDFAHLQAHEVVGGLLARIASLSTLMARNPQLWNANVGSVVLRVMAEALINMAWILEDPTVRSSEYVNYGLGQAKLELEQLKIAGFAPDDEAVYQRQAWLGSQQLSILTTVNVGSWSGQDTRTIADQVGYGDIYRLHFAPFSSSVHSHWHHVAKHNTVTCGNPLHRYHRVPIDKQSEIDPNVMWLAAWYLQEAFDRFDKVLGTAVTVPSAFARVDAAFNALSSAIEAKQAFGSFKGAESSEFDLLSVMATMGDPQLPDPQTIAATDCGEALVGVAEWVSLYLAMAAAAIPSFPADDKVTSVLVGHMVRLYKLYDTCVFLLCHQRQEMTSSFIASIFATVIHLNTIMSAEDQQTEAASFIQRGLAREKRLWMAVKTNQHDPPLPIEMRMLSSVERDFCRLGFAIEDIEPDVPEPDARLFQEASAHDAAQLYEFGYLPASDSFHGRWHDIEANHLKRDGASARPYLDYQVTQVETLQTVSSVCLEAVIGYSGRRLGEPGKLLASKARELAEWFGVVAQSRD